MKFRRFTKGVSPVIAVLLMIAIAVIAALVAYFWVMGYFRSTTTKVNKAIQIQSAAYTGSHLVVYVQNVGKGTVRFAASQCFYVDGVLREGANINPDTLQESDTATVIDQISLSLTQTIKIKVVTDEGTFAEATVTIRTFTGDYTLTLLIIGNGHVDLIPSAGAYYYDNVQLTAVPDMHWTFSGWNGDLSGTTNPASIYMNESKDVTATFLPIQHPITFDQNGVGPDFADPVVIIDGTNYAASDLPQSFSWNEGSDHSFSFASPLMVGSDKQYVWTSTSGLSTAQSATINVAGPGDVTATYESQYYLTVLSSYGTPGGAGWYDEGATAYATLNTDTVDHGNETRRMFIGWSGDASGSGYAQSNPITMDGARTAVADWQTQHEVTFDADPSDKGTTTPIPGTEWYDSGDISVSATATDPTYRFTSWTAVGSIMFADPFSDSTTATIGGPGTITANFALNTVEITITSDPEGPGYVKVDGTSYDTPQTFTWIVGDTYTLEALSPVGSGGTQHVYLSWSDGGAQIHDYIVPSSSETVTANYKIQYYLVVFSPSGYGDPTGTGWYDSGTTVESSVTSPWIVVGETDTQHVAAGFTGTGSAPSSGSGTSVSFTITSPSSITWAWTTQYYLSTSANFGDVSPSNGWYDEGSQVTVSATAPSAGAGEQYVWNGWTGTGSGSYTGLDNPATNAITMNGPVTETDSWTHQYYLTTSTNFGTVSPDSGWQNEGAVVSIEAIPPPADSGEQYVWNGWTGSGSGSYTGMDNPAVNAVTMNAPITETASWTHQYMLTMITNLGTTSPSVGDHWYDAESQVTISATAPTAGTGERYVWNGWTGSGSGSYTGTDNPATNAVTMSAPITETTSWTHQYMLTVVTDPSDLSPQPSRDPVGQANTANSWWYDASSSVELTAQPVAGHTFDHWDIDGTSQGTDVNPITVGIGAPHTATAHYTTGIPSTIIFFDDFNDGSIDAPWIKSGDTTPTCRNDEPAYPGASYYAYLTGSWGGENNGMITVTINTQDYSSIQLSYWRANRPYLIPDNLIVEWRVGTTGSWTTIETYSSTTWAQNTYSFPASADDQNTMQIRFAVNGPLSSWDHAYVDDVLVTGTPLPPHAHVSFTANSGTPTVDYQIESGGSGTTAVPFTVIVPVGKQISYTYQAEVVGVAGTKYVYMGVNPTSPLTVTDTSPVTVTGSYKTQYQLTVIDGGHGTSSGQGWYDAGLPATFSITPTTAPGTTGTQYVFTGWSGSGTGHYDGPDQSHQVTMNNPITETAQWKTQYYVTFAVSPPLSGTVNRETGWYDSGALSITATPANSSYVFSSWNSNTTSITFANSGSSTTTATISGTGTITANFVKQVTFVSAGTGSGSTNGNPTPGYPTSLQPNDLILLQVSVRGDSTPTITPPAGFALLYGPDATGGSGYSGDERVTQWVYYKFSTGSESGTGTVTITGTNYDRAARMYAFRNVALVSFAEGASYGVGNDDVILAQSVTTSGSGRLAVSFTSVNNDISVGSFTGESGGDWTEAVNEFTFNGDDDICMQLQTATMAGAGMIQNGSYDTGSNNYRWVVRALALKPLS